MGIDWTSVPPYAGHMAETGSRPKRRIDWEVIERDVLTTPGMTLSDAAEKWDVSYRTLKTHGGAKYGNWIARRRERMRELAQEREERVVAILAQDRAGNVQALRELEKRLERVCLSALELLFPPADAPVEAQLAARNRLESMSGSQLGALICQAMRTLTETGRHRRLLSGEATAIFARAEVPDVYIPESLEEARMREQLSRRAQTAILALQRGDPIEGAEVQASPVCARVESFTEGEEDLGL